MSNVPKVRAYCSASDHRISKICSGVCRDSQWFEEYLKIIEIGDNFSNERSFFAFFTSLTCADHIPLGSFCLAYQVTIHCINQSSSMSRIGVKNAKNERSFEKMITDFYNF